MTMVPSDTKIYNFYDTDYNPSLCIINGEMKCYDWWTSSPFKSDEQGRSTYLGFGERLDENSFGIKETGHFYIRDCNIEANLEFRVLDKRMRGSVINTLRNRAWVKKDFHTWITMLMAKNKLTKLDTLKRTDQFKFYSNLWNQRTDIEHKVYGNDESIDPCCTNTEKCSCGEFNIMSKTDYGWTCDICGFKIGRHGYAI